MKFIGVVLVAIVSNWCGLWGGGYGYGQSPSYLPPAAYGAAGYPMAGAPIVGAGGYGGHGYVPPPPPDDLAFVEGHGYPNAYRNSHLVRVVNDTEWFVRVRLDGEDLSFTDRYVGLHLLPPHTEGQFYAPLLETDLQTGCERHHFEFEAYLAPNFERPVVRSDREHLFCVGWEEQLINVRL